MPELNNPYGYIIVIGASILVVIIEMLILKRKITFRKNVDVVNKKGIVNKQQMIAAHRVLKRAFIT